MVNQTLNPGRYMKINSVNGFISKYQSSVLDTIKSECPSHTGEFDKYYSTQDLKNHLDLEFFRDMECSVTTHLILSESDLKY